jgi:ATP-dependent DNA helicase HFM1/MER3
VGLIGRIRVLCIDEVHTLSDNRGATLEAVVTRMRTVAANIRNDPSKANWPANYLRTIAVSATCPNLSEVGRWIGAGPETIYAFGDEFRPVHLVTHVIGYECKYSSVFVSF